MTTSLWYVYFNDEWEGKWLRCSEAYESFDEAVLVKQELKEKYPSHEYSVMRELIH